MTLQVQALNYKWHCTYNVTPRYTLRFRFMQRNCKHVRYGAIRLEGRSVRPPAGPRCKKELIACKVPACVSEVWGFDGGECTEIWLVIPCSLAEGYKHIAGFSETCVCFYQTHAFTALKTFMFRLCNVTQQFLCLSGKANFKYWSLKINKMSLRVQHLTWWKCKRITWNVCQASFQHQKGRFRFLSRCLLHYAGYYVN